MKIPFSRYRRIKSQITHATHAGSLKPAKASPDELLGELFQDVQLRQVYPDGMTFVDLVPANKLKIILKAYEKQRQRTDFNLHKFVEEYFEDYLKNPTGYKTNPDHTVEQHINELWDVLIHEEPRDRGSLVALPHPYIVPGGRFGAMWYWDTYFAMLGLAESGRYDLIEGMIKNYAFLIRKFGHIPCGTRTYYLSRSQPPFFSHMVELLAEKKGKRILLQYLPYLIAEYRYWMQGAKQLSENYVADQHAVRMPDGSILNRYFDAKRNPRPEMYKEDVNTALEEPDRLASKVYVDLRAAAESGWDFSSRWFKDGQNLHTIHTTDIVPVDLNCLMAHLEQTIAEAYRFAKQNWLAEKYEQKAEVRKATIDKYCWNKKAGFYFDYDFIDGKQTDHTTLAAVFPLYMNLASKAQANSVAQILAEKFLKPGGLVTTLATTGQQWDSPNGWPNLQWAAIVGLRNYGFNDLAEEIKKRWVHTNLAIYKEKGKLVEKYNVVDPAMPAGGGEYELQDGFGWTNGVLLKLLNEDKRAKKT